MLFIVLLGLVPTVDDSISFSAIHGLTTMVGAEC